MPGRSSLWGGTEHESGDGFDPRGGDVHERDTLDNTTHGLQRSIQLSSVALALLSVGMRSDRQVGNKCNVLSQMRPQDARIQRVVQARDLVAPFVGDDEYVPAAVDDVGNRHSRSNDERDWRMPEPALV